MATEQPRSFVLGAGSWAPELKPVHDALLAVAPEAPLCTATAASSLLDPGDPVEGALARRIGKYLRERDADRARGDVGFGDSAESFGVILVVFGALGGGVAGAAGADAWGAVKRGAVRAWQRAVGRRSPKDGADPDVEGLFADLAAVYQGALPREVPILMRVVEARVTLVVEPELPEEALHAVGELCGPPGRGSQLEVPLRWDGDARRWCPLEPDWAEGGRLRSLAWDVDPKLRRRSR